MQETEFGTFASTCFFSCLIVGICCIGRSGSDLAHLVGVAVDLRLANAHQFQRMLSLCRRGKGQDVGGCQSVPTFIK